MKTLASACQSRLAAAVLLDMGAAPALASLRAWAARGHWTRHDWMQEEVAARVEEVAGLLRGAQDLAPAAAAGFAEMGAEEPFFCSFLVRASSVELHARPDFGAPVLATLKEGRTVRTSAHRGLWLRARAAEAEGWLIAYKDGCNVGDMTDWHISGWEP